MISFLFWNLAKRALLDRVVRIAATFNIDVLILAECAINPLEVVAALNRPTPGAYSFPYSAGEKLRIFIRSPPYAVTDLYNDSLGRLTIRRLELSTGPELLLAAVHFPSKSNWCDVDQALETTAVAAGIVDVEDSRGHRRTVLVGDLNMNPFDKGVVASHALHAVMTRELARREERIVQGRPYRFFYNPMWGCLGDRTHGPPGSYFLASSKPSNLFWNLYDQVLLRPSIMERLDDLTILDTDGRDRLVSHRGRPTASDHLPLFFRLSL